MDFLQSNFNVSTKKASFYTLLNIFVLSLPVIFLYNRGVFDDIDFWIGTILIIIVSLLEIYTFAWTENAENNMRTLMESNLIKLKKIVFYVIKYVVPVILLLLLILWMASDGFKIIFTENRYLWFTRTIILFYILFLLYLIKVSSDNRGDSI
jgi:SNF family Na+-dependent transporter